MPAAASRDLRRIPEHARHAKACPGILGQAGKEAASLSKKNREEHSSRTSSNAGFGHQSDGFLDCYGFCKSFPDILVVVPDNGFR